MEESWRTERAVRPQIQSHPKKRRKGDIIDRKCPTLLSTLKMMWQRGLGSLALKYQERSPVSSWLKLALLSLMWLMTAGRSLVVLV
jgi:hypothetical protein